MASLETVSIIATFVQGVGGNVQTGADENRHVTVEFTPGEITDISRIEVASTLGVVESFYIDFVDTCTPDNPFYVRWVNRLGGWEYWMFAANKRIATEVKETDAYAPYSGGFIDANRTREVLAIERIDTVEVGEEAVDPADFELLASIALSPRVDRYNDAAKRWEGVTLADKHVARWDTRGSRGAISYTFRLIDQENQF